MPAVTNAATQGLDVEYINGLECKICVKTYRLFFVEHSEDFLRKIPRGGDRSRIHRGAVRDRASFRAWVDGAYTSSSPQKEKVSLSAALQHKQTEFKAAPDFAQKHGWLAQLGTEAQKRGWQEEPKESRRHMSAHSETPLPWPAHFTHWTHPQRRPLAHPDLPILSDAMQVDE